MRTCVPVLAVLLALCGCGASREQILRKKASAAIGCEEDRIAVRELSDSFPFERYAACGCGATMTYTYFKGPPPMTDRKQPTPGEDACRAHP